MKKTILLTKGLLIDPSIPAEWDGFTVERSFRGCRLMIKVENPDHVQHGVKEIRVNGERIDLKNEPLLTERILNDRSKANVQVIMGSKGEKYKWKRRNMEK